MRILDEDNNEILEPDYDLGYTTEEAIVTAHHEAMEAVEEIWHYEVIREYPNGGRDVKRVVDVPGVRASEAWDETEAILRWHPYSAEELAAIEAEKQAALEEWERQERRARSSPDNVEIGRVFGFNGMYYRATRTILRGEEIRPGTNCDELDVAQLLNKLLEGENS